MVSQFFVRADHCKLVAREAAWLALVGNLSCFLGALKCIAKKIMHVGFPGDMSNTGMHNTPWFLIVDDGEVEEPRVGPDCKNKSCTWPFRGI